MRTEFLPFSAPSIGADEIAAVVETLQSEWLTSGPKVRRFEREFGAAVEAPAALGLSSCTNALHLALKVFNVGPGDAVITTPMTFCGGVNVIEHVGAVPVLADVSPDNLQIDPERIRRALAEWHAKPGGPRVKALMPVHLHGHPCDLEAVMAIAQEHDLAVIEDAAHALPARYQGKPIGFCQEGEPVRRLTCFSFYAIKNLTTMEGGMMTGAPELIEEARVWSSHGMDRDAARRNSDGEPWRYDVVRAGFKCNMTDVQAALGLCQLSRLSLFHARRREIAARYTAAFQALEELEVPAVEAAVEHAWHLYVIRLNLDKLSLDRAAFIRELEARKIGTSVHFTPVHLFEFYRLKYGYEPQDFPVAHREFQRIVSLPLYPKMSDQDAADVISAVCEVVERYRLC